MNRFRCVGGVDREGRLGSICLRSVSLREKRFKIFGREWGKYQARKESVGVLDIRERKNFHRWWEDREGW